MSMLGISLWRSLLPIADETTNSNTHTCKHTHTHTHTRANTHTQTASIPHTHTQTHTHTHPQTHTCCLVGWTYTTHTERRAQKRKTHTNANTPPHTHTHTHARTSAFLRALEAIDVCAISFQSYKDYVNEFSICLIWFLLRILILTKASAGKAWLCPCILRRRSPFEHASNQRNVCRDSLQVIGCTIQLICKNSVRALVVAS